MSRRSPPGPAAGSTARSASGASSSTNTRPTSWPRASATPAGSATARRKRSWSRPTAWRRAGRRNCPGYQLFRTIWAFAHEEAGDTRGAERAVDAAIEADRTNYFAHHVKAHVLEMECRPREGSEWLASQAEHWSLANQLAHHLWWHRALMQLELGELDAVLASYDENIRNLDAPMTKATPDHFIDLQNAPAVLWRLEQMGVDVGHRWEELADKAEARIGHAGHPLLVPHLMMALAATGRAEVAERFLAGAAGAGRRPAIVAGGDAERGDPAVLRGCAGAPRRRLGTGRRIAGTAPRADPPARRQQRAARPVHADAARRGGEGRPPRPGGGGHRASGGDPRRAPDRARRLRRGRAVGRVSAGFKMEKRYSGLPSPALGVAEGTLSPRDRVKTPLSLWERGWG